ncbi:MAG: hypothetical protein K8U57_27595 [Planctomycetes bacterium]|nr:hypothetical protein [Planctomycetota bacterium]
MTHQPIRLVRHNSTPQPLRVGGMFLERLQQVTGMPYHAPTLQFRRSGEHTQHFEAANPLAQSLLAAFRHDRVTVGQLDALKACGFAVEIRS